VRGQDNRPSDQAGLDQGELDAVHAFIDAARQAALMPGLEAAGSLSVQGDLDYMESELISDTPDAAGLRAVGARVQAVILGVSGEELSVAALPLPLRYAIARFPHQPR
jgi:hypothetical protein